LDVNVKPAVGAEYTLSTFQLDFCLPARFNLKYIDQDGTEKTPVVLHRAILGSLDRFMAYLIEETKGAFPLWLAPVQVKVLPVSDKSMDYAAEIHRALMAEGIRSELDERNEKIGYKIRYARQEDKVPYMLIIGEKETSEGTVSVRDRATDQTVTMTLEELTEKLQKEIRERA
ncbi:MAG: threonine--tRNA ligase, partial [Clostridia bacterium]|nr:threonine--tRNA ligase [Clostridia bacterium]